MNTAIKQQLIDACTAYVNEKLKTSQDVISDVEAALKQDTKCSMGDKYETERAMLHLEFEKVAGQHTAFQKLRQTLRMLPATKTTGSIAFGAVVKTSAANYFISIPAGKLMVNGEEFYAIGVGAPIAQALLGKKAGESALFGGKEIYIQEIL